MYENFEIFYPNSFSDQEIEAMDRALKVSSEPGPMAHWIRTEVTADKSEMLRYNSIWSPYDPLYNDESYANKSAKRGMTAFPCFVQPIAMPAQVPQEIGSRVPPMDSGLQIPGSGYDTEIQYFLPIRPGNTYRMVQGEKYFEDVTPEKGAPYRAIRCVSIGEMYDSDDRLVSRSVGSQINCYYRYLDPSKSEPMVLTPLDGTSENHFSLKRGEAHFYTEDDYDFIREIWAKEKIRGSETLYWEDVNIGDEPPWTCDGPMTNIDLIRYHGMTVVESEPLRNRVMRDGIDRLYKDRWGMRYMDWCTHYCNLNLPHGRAYCYNTTVRNQICRMVTNWMGDAGLVANVGWRLGVEQKGFEDYNRWPEGFARESWLLKVPYLKEAGKYMNAHAMVGDLSICKGYVHDKYYDETGHYVVLTGWAETIEGYITCECTFTVKLPSKTEK